MSQPEFSPCIISFLIDEVEYVRQREIYLTKNLKSELSKIQKLDFNQFFIQHNFRRFITLEKIKLETNVDSIKYLELDNGILSSPDLETDININNLLHKQFYLLFDIAIYVSEKSKSDSDATP